MSRITLKMLEATCEHLNRITGSPLESHTKISETGFPRHKSNPDHFCLSQAYGGVKLVRYCTEGGGATDITHGYDTKSDLYDKMQAYIAGVRLGMELKNE